MKKLLLTGLVALSMAFATTVQGQVKFGIKGGVNVVDMSISGHVLDKSNRAGFYLGPTVKVGLPLTGFSLDGALLYDQRTSDVTVERGNEQITQEEYSLRQKQLAIPVNIRYSLGLGETLGLFFFGGPQFGLNLSDDIDDIDFKWKNTNFSINLGVGIKVLNHIEASIDYNIGCGHTGEASAQTISDAFRSKSGSFQIGVAYYF